MNRLRFWFLLPAWLWLVLLFLAPLVIVCAYSLLSRGTYGGVELPWTLESYRRLIDRSTAPSFYAPSRSQPRRRPFAWSWDFRWRCLLHALR